MIVVDPKSKLFAMMAELALLNGCRMPKSVRFDNNDLDILAAEKELKAKWALFDDPEVVELFLDGERDDRQHFVRRHKLVQADKCLEEFFGMMRP